MIALDSCAVIDFLKGNRAMQEILKENRYCVTEITVFEVLFGTITYGTKKELDAVLTLFSMCTIFPFSEGKKAAVIKFKLKNAGQTINNEDILTTATLQARGVKEIVTNDTQHFPLLRVRTY